MASRITPSNSYVRSLAPPKPRPAGQQIRSILPDYRITHLLGSGGFAKVYQATDSEGLEVAVKIPRMDDLLETLDMDVIEKFQAEAEIWKKLKHDHIVDFFDSNTAPLPYISMELMDGGSLKDLMKNRKLTVGESVHIMLQVLEGLSYAHRMASVHRDIKPENILFTLDGTAKMTDWGIGKYMASASLTKTVGTKGTLAYSAPEQFAKRKFGKVDWQTDIFQVGVLFYEMLTGINPFEGQDMAEVMGNVLTYHPNPPSSYNPDVPKELDRIIMGALEKDKKRRLLSGTVMLDRLKQFVEKGPQHSQQYSKQRPRASRPPHSSPKPDQRVRELRGGQPFPDQHSIQRAQQIWENSKIIETVKSKIQVSKKGIFKKKYSYKTTSYKIEIRTNLFGMKFVKIPGRDYYIGKYTITQKQWEAVMGTTPWKRKKRVKEGDDYPAIYISWNDCQEFISALNKKVGGWKYRLPTEGEWEHACRAGSTTKYCFGDDNRWLREYAWYRKNAKWTGEKYPHKVGRKKPNKWGLYDVHGNVWEWTSTEAGSYHVLRGGCWYDSTDYCRSSDRLHDNPSRRALGVGLRLARLQASR